MFDKLYRFALACCRTMLLLCGVLFLAEVAAITVFLAVEYRRPVPPPYPPFPASPPAANQPPTP